MHIPLHFRELRNKNKTLLLRPIVLQQHVKQPEAPSERDAPPLPHDGGGAAIRNRSRYLRSVLPSLLALPVQKKLRQAFWQLCSSRAECRERGVQRSLPALLAAGHACQQLVKLVKHVSAASKACWQIVRGCPCSQSRYLLRHAF
jgi:hypothetical protein